MSTSSSLSVRGTSVSESCSCNTSATDDDEASRQWIAQRRLARKLTHLALAALAVLQSLLADIAVYIDRNNPFHDRPVLIDQRS